MNTNKLHRIGTLTACALLLIWLTNSASAGEITGNGKPIDVKGKSECAYSGLQDDPEEDEGIFRGDRVQNWGQLPKAVRDIIREFGLLPGDACNPAKADEGEDP
jgi:hypothetical protein